MNSNEDEVLEELEKVFILLRHIKQYVGEQKERIEQGFCEEEQGYYALIYLHNVLLAFVNERISVTSPPV